MSKNDPFPNVQDKLTAPSKKSAFEKARLEAEAKRQREEAETAAVYRDFVASFDEEAPHGSTPPPGFGARGGFRGGMRGGPPSGPGRRHFTGPPGTGRGGLSLSGPPPNLARKRNLGNAFEADEEEGGVFGSNLSERERRRMRESNTGLLAFENSAPPSKRAEQYDDDSDSDSAKQHPKPTVQLRSLPPNTTKATITTLFAPTPVKIDSIRIIPAPPPPGPSQPSPSIRKAASALVTLSSETPSSDIETTVSSLNGQYLGSGFWLDITRHLPSTVAGATSIPLGNQSNPFGAVAPRPTGPVGVRGGPHRGGFAPPSSFGGPGRAQQGGGLQVHVHPPQDLKQLKLIHKTIESILTHGAQFEALLMAKESVKSDPKFAWLWDARSPGGIYYRWKLWEIVSGYSLVPDDKRRTNIEIFEPSGLAGGATWIPPRKSLKYEWAESLKDVVDDEGFVSDELDEDESDRENNDEDRPIGLAGGEGKRARGYLGVLDRAKLIHLISRMPTVTSKVRRGDVGRVMAFAMEHAEGGMGEEVVDILVSNVLNPLQFTKAAKQDEDDSDMSEDEKEKQQDGEKPDTSAAKIIALWLISDVLSNSSLGVRAAWRYRQLFDMVLREKGVFRHLGEIYRGSGWGRMKAEKFRRGVVEGVLEGWEKWCIFPQTTQEHFLKEFLEPPTAQSKDEKVQSQKSRSNTPAVVMATPAAPAAKQSRWKTVDAAPSAFNPEQPVDADVDEDIDGAPMVDDEDIDGEPLTLDDDDDDVDGEPMVDDNDDTPMEEAAAPPPLDSVPERARKEGEEKGTDKAALAGKRKRPTALDMFADDDEYE